MQNANRNVLVTIVVVLGLLILVGAYFLFQGKSAFPNAATTTGTGTSTSNILGQTTVGGATVTVSTPTGTSNDFGISVDTSHLVVGGTIPSIKVHLPPNSDGKALAFALKPTTATSSFATMVLFAYVIDGNATTTQVSGIHLSEYIDGKTGAQHVPLPAGQYELQAVLWDRNPFFQDGTYGDLSNHNNATAVMTQAFTISAQ